MSKYYYCPFPGHKDGQLSNTKKAYAPKNGLCVELVSCYDPVENDKDGSPALTAVKAGDLIYLNAHGLNSQPGTIQAKFKEPSGCGFFAPTVIRQMKAGDLAMQMVKYDGLPDGTEGSPIYIKCLICYAGGPDLNAESEEALLGSEEGKKHVLKSARGRFANLLATALREQGRSHIMVGGYPGEIKARPKKVASLWVESGGIERMPRFTKLSGQKAAAWFDMNGNLYYKSEKKTFTLI